MNLVDVVRDEWFDPVDHLVLVLVVDEADFLNTGKTLALGPIGEVAVQDVGVQHGDVGHPHDRTHHLGKECLAVTFHPLQQHRVIDVLTGVLHDPGQPVQEHPLFALIRE